MEPTDKNGFSVAYVSDEQDGDLSSSTFSVLEKQELRSLPC